MAAPVHAELMAARGRDEAFLDSFLQNTGIQVDWNVVEGDWRAAGRAFQSYTGRRSKHREPWPRRILADFLIGAHAWRRGYRLLTLDAGLYQAAFPHLTIARL